VSEPLLQEGRRVLQTDVWRTHQPSPSSVRAPFSPLQPSLSRVRAPFQSSRVRQTSRNPRRGGCNVCNG